MTRGNVRVLTAEFEGDEIVFDELKSDDPIVPNPGSDVRIGRHEGCYGDGVFLSLGKNNGLKIYCAQAMCLLEITQIPMSVNTPEKLRVFLRDISYLPRSMGAR